MHVHLPDIAAVAVAAFYALLVGIAMPLLVTFRFGEKGRSPLVIRLATIAGALAALGIITASLLINHYLIFMSAAAAHLFDGVSNAAVFSNIAASTWIAPPPEHRKHLRKPACIVLSLLTIAALLMTLPQAMKLAGS